MGPSASKAQWAVSAEREQEGDNREHRPPPSGARGSGSDPPPGDAPPAATCAPGAPRRSATCVWVTGGLYLEGPLVGSLRTRLVVVRI